MFRELSDGDKERFREWARNNYTPFTEVDSLWHPVVQEECERINEEVGAGQPLEKVVAVECPIVGLIAYSDCVGCPYYKEMGVVEHCMYSDPKTVPEESFDKEYEMKW